MRKSVFFPMVRRERVERVEFHRPLEVSEPSDSSCETKGGSNIVMRARKESKRATKKARKVGAKMKEIKKEKRGGGARD